VHTHQISPFKDRRRRFYLTQRALRTRFKIKPANNKIIKAPKSHQVEGPLETAGIKGFDVASGSAVFVACGTGVFVCVLVAVAVGVFVAVGVLVGVVVGVGVAVFVGVEVAVLVGVGQGVYVAVISGVAVSVARIGVSRTAGGSPVMFAPASTKKSGGPPISHASRQRAPSKFRA